MVGSFFKDSLPPSFSFLPALSAFSSSDRFSRSPDRGIGTISIYRVLQDLCPSFRCATTRPLIVTHPPPPCAVSVPISLLSHRTHGPRARLLFSNVCTTTAFVYLSSCFLHNGSLPVVCLIPPPVSVTLNTSRLCPVCFHFSPSPPPILFFSACFQLSSFTLRCVSQ
jgi:hypothetical protein